MPESREVLETSQIRTAKKGVVKLVSSTVVKVSSPSYATRS
jgi:hypothetical protein